MSGFSWDRRIARTSELLQNQSSVTELLKFYQRLVRFQKSVYESVASSADHDVSLLVPHFAALLALVKEAGSADLKAAAATWNNRLPKIAWNCCVPSGSMKWKAMSFLLSRSFSPTRCFSLLLNTWQKKIHPALRHRRRFVLFADQGRN